MKKTLILLVAAVPLFAASDFDFKQLDKLAANAKESTNITLEGPVLKMASGFIGSSKDKDSAAVKSLIDGLKGVYIRSFEFEDKGKYTEADLDPLRAYLDAQHWTKIVDVKESREASTIYVLTLPDSKPGGIAIISAEPKEVTVVLIEGAIDINDIGKLGGRMGIPDVGLLNGMKKKEKTAKDQ